MPVAARMKAASPPIPLKEGQGDYDSSSGYGLGEIHNAIAALELAAGYVKGVEADVTRDVTPTAGLRSGRSASRIACNEHLGCWLDVVRTLFWGKLQCLSPVLNINGCCGREHEGNASDLSDTTPQRRILLDANSLAWRRDSC